MPLKQRKYPLYYISQQELVSGVGALGLNLSSAEVKAIFTLADVNQDGEVNYTEFVSA